MTLEKIEENLVEYEIEADYTYCYMLRSDKGFNSMNAAFLSQRSSFFYDKIADNFEEINDLLRTEYLSIGMTVEELDNINQLSVSFKFSFNTDLGENAIDIFGRSNILPQEEINLLWDKFEKNKHLFNSLSLGVLEVFISDRRHMSIDTKETKAFMKEKQIKTKTKIKKEIETQNKEEVLEI